MLRAHSRPATILLTLAILGCQTSSTTTTPTPPTPSPAPQPARTEARGVAHPEMWPTVQSAIPRDARIESQIDAILSRMSVEEKVGQVMQPSITAIKPEDVKTYHIGSILNGGGGWPGDVRQASPRDWLALSDAMWAASMDTSDGKQAIPIIWGSDAVHGHSNIVGATLFPHNIGMGATRNYDLIRREGEITAREMAVTGINWTFSPVVAVTRDDRWGRTYESYSEDPEVVRAAAVAVVEGLQGKAGTPALFSPDHVVATAKHFLGDGGTASGKDQTDVVVSEEMLRDIHGAGYVEAIRAGVQTVMISQSSWQGREMHGNRSLLTGVLKERMGFDGILVGDWNGHAQVPGCTNKSCPDALNAGLDMYMVPDDWKDLYVNTLAQAKSGVIPMSRLDDAVRRILRVKLRAGLFTAPKPSQRAFGGRMELIGSLDHRGVARQAVRESLVLLKNNGGVLPIKPAANVLVAGDANDIPKQTGGWTLSWQGDQNSNRNFPGATTIWEGIQGLVAGAGGRAMLSPDGSFADKPDVAIVVFGENPYAEWEGDLRHVVYRDDKALATLTRLKSAGVPTVSVFLSGRPMWVNPLLNASDAFVAAWLPGTEGHGIAEVLIAKADGSVRNDFRGKLPFSWPKLATQVKLNRGDADYDPLFPFGFGLTYADRATLPQLATDTTGVNWGKVFYTAGPRGGLKIDSTPGVTAWDEAGGRKVASWSGTGPGSIRVFGDQPMNLTDGANENLVMSIDILVEKAPTSPVTLSMGCGPACSGGVDITSLLRGMTVNEWNTIRVPLRCFVAAGTDIARVSTPFQLSTSGQLAIRFGDVELMPPAAGESGCPPQAVAP